MTNEEVQKKKDFIKERVSEFFVQLTTELSTAKTEGEELTNRYLISKAIKNVADEIDDARHAELFASNPEYAKRCESITFDEGKELVLRVKVISPRRTTGLFDSLYSNKDNPELIAGCVLTELFINDPIAKHNLLVKDLNELRHKHSVVQFFWPIGYNHD